MRRALFAAIAAVSLLSAPAIAGPPGSAADPKFAARALAEHGHSLFEAGRYAEAIDVLTQAEKLYHAPTISLALAGAYAAAGRLVEARAIYDRVAEERLEAGAPKVWKDAQRAAKEARAALDKRIPAVRVLVRGGGGRGLRVSVDQREITAYRPDDPIPVDPGSRVVTVVPHGGVGKSRNVELQEGARVTVEIDLGAPLPVAPAPARAAEAASAPWRVPSYICFGAGAAGLALGIGAGVVTLNMASRLKAACPTGTCPTSAHDADIDAANGMGVASTMGFVLAGLGGVAGLVLWLVPKGDKAPVHMTFGPGSIDVRGSF